MTDRQEWQRVQYWKPEAADEFAGDMMPYWDGERFHLFYLLDHNHHADFGGLGGHHWAHASTADLVNWQHHPLAVPRGAPGAYDENGICTGSICEHDGTYYAFYASRIRNANGSGHREAVSRAEGQDLVHFTKSPANPLFFAPPELDAWNHRDPYVFRHPETGQFHMLVTASRVACIPGDGPERGLLAHYTSPDLGEWEYVGPFLSLDADPAPECPEHFFWNGWWYLLYSQHQQMRYWVSKNPLGPWLGRGRGTIEGMNLSVPRTAAFAGGRRLAAGFLQGRAEERDNARYEYAGNVVFRELMQAADGTLTTRFVPEMMPPAGPPSEWRLMDTPPGVREGEDGLSLAAADTFASARISGVPIDGTLFLRFACDDAGEYGLILRGDPDLQTGYRLSFSPREGRVTLRRWPRADSLMRAKIADLDNLQQGAEVLVCMSGSIIDVCVNGRRTMVERVFDFQGTTLAVWARAGTVRVEGLSVSPLRAA